jgi:hypothetical protein
VASEPEVSRVSVLEEQDEAKIMKQKLDEVRTLAIKLYEAGQREKRRQPTEIWGTDCLRNWRDLPSESVAVWDAIAFCAYRLLKRHNK